MASKVNSSGLVDSNAHFITLSSGLMKQRLEGKFCDLSLNVFGHSVTVHSCVLAIFCRPDDSDMSLWSRLQTKTTTATFEVEISKEERETVADSVYMDALNKIVEFVYTGRIQIDSSNVHKIRLVAEKLQLSEIIGMCNRFNKTVVDDSRITNRKKRLKRRKKSNKVHVNSSANSGVLAAGLACRKIEVNDAYNCKQIKLAATGFSDDATTDNTESPNCDSPKAKKSMPCVRCPYVANSVLQLRIHERTHVAKSYTCGSCGFIALKVKRLLCHLKERRHKETVCSLCSFEAESSQHLYDHLQRHDNKKPFFCLSCDLRFQTRTALNLHLPKHSNQKPYLCTVCGRGFKWKHALQTHSIVHTQEKHHLCDQCGYRSAHQSSFKAHCLLHSGNTFKCTQPGCSFQAVRKQNLQQHLKTHTKEKPYQCEVCGHAFSLVKNLRRHARIHNTTESSIQCTNCDFSTTRVDKMKEHNKKHHTAQATDKTASTPNCALSLFLLDGTVTTTSSNCEVAGVETDSISETMNPSHLVPLRLESFETTDENQTVIYSTIEMSQVLPVYTIEHVTEPTSNAE